MPTLRQLVRYNKRISKKTKCLVPKLDKCPQKKGVVERVFTVKPKKPNSARRRVAKVRLVNNKILVCHIPGEGHTLTKHSVVLVRGGRAQDLIGVRYKPIRGKFDLKPVEGRISRRSKYGIKK
ncbi:30S ribosomal protein S12 [archaeon]|jgi:small subunit ribosomal protein S12|nr:30S ribosomal protein S12 [archaeon]